MSHDVRHAAWPKSSAVVVQSTRKPCWHIPAAGPPVPDQPCQHGANQTRVLRRCIVVANYLKVACAGGAINSVKESSVLSADQYIP